MFWTFSIAQVKPIYEEWSSWSYFGSLHHGIWGTVVKRDERDKQIRVEARKAEGVRFGEDVIMRVRQGILWQGTVSETINRNQKAKQKQ